MLDIHSHILPNVDDGSGSVEESLQLLKASAQQGIDLMAATPHFYASQNSPQQFLERRTAAVQALKEVWTPDLPRIVLGAEVCYFDGVSRMEELPLLRIGGTNILLLEMPFTRWSGRMLEEISAIQDRRNTQVLLAHIERYLPFQNSGALQTLREQGVKMQCNASFFLNWRTKRKALKMLRRGEINALGSDCHNMTSRPPRLGETIQVIQKSVDRSVWLDFQRQLPDLMGKGARR